MALPIRFEPLAPDAFAALRHYPFNDGIRSSAVRFEDEPAPCPLILLLANWQFAVVWLWEEDQRRTSLGKPVDISTRQVMDWLTTSRRFLNSFDVPTGYPEVRNDLQRVCEGIENGLDFDRRVLGIGETEQHFRLSVYLNAHIWMLEHLRHWLSSKWSKWTTTSGSNGNPFDGREFYGGFLNSIAGDFPANPSNRSRSLLEILQDGNQRRQRVRRAGRRIPRDAREEAFMWVLNRLRQGPLPTKLPSVKYAAAT